MMQIYDGLCLQGDKEGSVLIRGSESHKKSKCQHSRHFLQIRMMIIQPAREAHRPEGPEH